MNNGTIARTITSALVAINSCLIMFGVDIFQNATEDVIYKVVSAVVMVVAWVVSHYKNNDFTKEACEGTGYTRMLKAQKDGVDNGENFFDEAEEVE